jgi:hypothetical protein
VNTIGPFIVTACALHVPESGSWVLDVDHDLPLGAPAPTGKVVCLVGSVPFVGTVDPESSGVFGTRARSRVVGALEWRSSVPKRDFQNPAGVTSTVVISATAAEIGVPVVVLAPEVLDTHFTRVAGLASQVLGRSGWWVSPAGVTTVGPRPPSVPGLDFFLSEYDPLTRMARVTSSAPIMPGMIIPDPRLPGGALRVREVEQTWSEGGASASLWMGDLAAAPARGPRLAHAIQSLATAAIRPELLTHYAYTVVGQSPDGGYLLQAAVSGPVPDATPVVHWPGIPGFSCVVQPGSRVVVGFRGSEPIVLGFDDAPPLSGTWDYTTMKLGGELAKPTANEDVIDGILALIAAVNAAIPSGVAYPTILDDAAEIKATLAAMRTRSA